MKIFRFITTCIWKTPKTIYIFIIKIYRFFISPLYGPVCKYYPSCSEYSLKAVKTHGFCKGIYLTGWRILRCNPWSLGGVDEIPLKKNKHKNLQKKIFKVRGTS